jgi:hypothetical protein
MTGLGAVVGGRWTYEAADHWGDTNPWGVPFFIVTHRPQEQPKGDAFTFVDGVAEAIAQAKEAAGDKHVHVMGGADVIRKALEARACRRVDNHRRAGRAWRRQGAVRGIREVLRVAAARCTPIAVRHLHRLPGGAVVTAIPSALRPHAVEGSV